MKDALKRMWVPLLAVSLAQLMIHSIPLSISGGVADAISKAVLGLGLLLATSFIGGAVHAGLLRGRLDAGLTVCFVDGATLGLLSNLMTQVLSIAIQGPPFDLVMPSGDAGAVLWAWKLFLFFVILMIFGFIGLLSGGMGGSAGYLVSLWMASATTVGGKRG